MAINYYAARGESVHVSHYVSHYPAGLEAIALPGDLILTHSPEFVGRMIRFGQALRWRGRRKVYAHYSHAAMVVACGPLGATLVEALGNGVDVTGLSKYRDIEYSLVHTGDLASGDPLALARVLTFTRHAVGRRYGYGEILCLGLALLTGMRLRFSLDGQMICSGLAAGALSRTDAIFPHEPAYMMPADLAEYYDVRPWTPNVDTFA